MRAHPDNLNSAQRLRRTKGSVIKFLMESICVCIAAYNAESTIARAISSALGEPNVSEVIVVDDASTDLTAARARQCDDGTGRLSVIVREMNGGPAAARN